MSYINEQTSSMADFVSKLDTFLTGTPGWTQDQHDAANGKWAIHKTGTGMNIYVSFRWDTSSPNYLGIYQALAFVGVGTDPGNHTDDSGNGYISGTDSLIDNERSVKITNAPVQYWCFEDDDYAHVVVEHESGKYSHFGFGFMDKLGDWTGGEYCYGHRMYTPVSSLCAVDTRHTFLLDGICDNTNMEYYCATVHAESLPNQTGKWAVFMGDQASGSLGTDRGSTARSHFTGGFRGGPIARVFGRFGNGSEKALMPGYPLGIFYWDRTDDSARFLGWMPDVRGVNIEYFAGGDELTVGSDTWVLFPSYAKGATGSTSNTSMWQGIAYKKVTT